VKIKGRRKKRKFIEKINRNDFIVQEWQTFIHALPKQFSKKKLKQLDKYFSFKTCGNSEIMTDWFVLGIRNNYTELNPEIEKFLSKVGRRKYILPIYEALKINESTSEFAKKIFKKNSGNYHAVSRNSITELLAN
jgi:hypothetical protein